MLSQLQTGRLDRSQANSFFWRNDLRTWSFLLASEECKQGNVGDLDNLESNTGDISYGVTRTTETSNQNLVVLLNVVEATVIWHEGRDLLSVLDELNTNTLADGRVWLFSLNSNFF